MVSTEIQLPDLSTINQRIVDWGILGVNRDFQDTLILLGEANPDSSLVKVYREFTNLLPFFIREDTNKAIFHAIDSSHPRVAQAGRHVMTLFNMKTILSASAPFFTGIPEDDEELIQAAFTRVLAKISDPSFTSLSSPIYKTIYDSATEGAILLRNERFNMPIQIEHEGDEIIDEDDMLRFPANVHLRRNLQTSLAQIPVRPAYAVACEFGLITDESGNSLSRSSIAERLGNVTRQRVEQLINHGLEAINELPKVKRLLTPHLCPERLDLAVESKKLHPLSVYLGFELDERRLRNYGEITITQDMKTSKRDFKDRYKWGRKFGVLDMHPDTIKALYDGKVRNLADLLSRSVNDLINIKGIDEDKLNGIVGSVKDYLDRSEQIINYMEQYQQSRS